MWTSMIVASESRSQPLPGILLRACFRVAALAAVCIAGCSSSGMQGTNGNSGNGGGTTPYAFPPGPALQFVSQFGTGTYFAASMQGDTMAALTSTLGGDLLVAGYTAGNLPGYTGVVGVLKATLYMLNASGGQIWARELSTGAGDTFNGVAATSSGILAAGTTKGALSGTNPGGIDEPFLASFGLSGNLQWLKQYPSVTNTQVESMCIDASGNVILGGETSDSQHGQDLFLEKLDSAGNELWQKIYGNGAVDLVTGVTADANGDIDVTGSTNGPFPGGPSNDLGIPFVLQLDGSTGATLWLQQFNGEAALAAMSPSAMQIAPGGKLDLLGQVGSYGTNAQIEVVQLDEASGDVAWNTGFGAGTENLPGESLAVAANGDLYVTGMTHGALIPGATAGVDDIFLAKISPTGGLLWAEQMGTGSDGPARVSTGSVPFYVTLNDLSVVVGGMTAGQFPGFSNPNHAIELFVAGYPQ